MPSTRRSTGSTGASRSKSKPTANQTTLAFSNKNRVAKPNSTYVSEKKISPISKKLSSADIVLPIQSAEEDAVEETSFIEVAKVRDAVEVKPKPAAEDHVDDIDDEARKIKESHIKKYFNEKEKSRKAARVHQKDLSIHEKILRDWDVDSGYGPCIGISRTKRWKRAHKLGLNPPLEVLAVLIMEQDAAKKSERAHLDELMVATS